MILNLWSYDLGTEFTIENCLFGAVYLTKNVGKDKYRYSGYGIGFNICSFSLPNGNGFAKNVITFGVDSGSLVHVNNKKKYILIFKEGPTDGLDDSKITAEPENSINFTETKKICLRLSKVLAFCMLMM